MAVALLWRAYDAYDPILSIHRTHTALERRDTSSASTDSRSSVSADNNTGVALLFQRSIANIVHGITLLEQAARAGCVEAACNLLVVCQACEITSERLLSYRLAPDYTALYQGFVELERKQCDAASYAVAACLFQGQGVEMDQPAALRRFVALADHVLGARNYLAYIYHYGSMCCTRNPVLAFQLYSTAAAKGYIPSIANIGRCYEEGDGAVKQDRNLAVLHFQKAADAGFPYAQKDLARIWEHESHSAKMAFRYRCMAAEAGDRNSQYTVGYHYSKGEEGVVIKAPVAAEHWWERAAAQNSTSALIALANLAYERKAKGDDVRCFDLYRKAGELGHTDAMYGVGKCFEWGHGTAKDMHAALQWYRKAAERGSTLAQVELGHAYHLGTGVAPDGPQAFTWYSRAAERHNMAGRVNLAGCYEHGVGVKKDLRAACQQALIVCLASSKLVPHSDTDIQERAENSLVTYRQQALRDRAVAQELYPPGEDSIFPGVLVPFAKTSASEHILYGGVALHDTGRILITENDTIHVVRYDGSVVKKSQHYGEVCDIAVHPLTGDIFVTMSHALWNFCEDREPRMLTRWVGQHSYGDVDGTFEEAEFHTPRALAYDLHTCTWLVVDGGNRSIRGVHERTRLVSTIARFPGGYMGGIRSILASPELGCVLLVNTERHCVYQLAGSELRVVIGTDDGRSAELTSPVGLAYDVARGDLYITDQHAVRRCQPACLPADHFFVTGLLPSLCALVGSYAATFGKAEVFVGSADGQSGHEFGLRSSRLFSPQGLVIDRTRRTMFIWDAGNSSICAVDLPPAHGQDTWCPRYNTALCTEETV